MISPAAVLLTAALAAPASAGAGPAPSDTVWLCRPGIESNPCRESLATTVESPDGGSRTTDPPLPRRPRVDCFYVYPTVSEQPAVNADRSIDPELVAIARYQAARFSKRCRVFAPVYRQLTIFGLNSPEERQREGSEIAYADVRAAFRDYLRHHSRGRGFILLGHSQGTFMLRRLIRERVETVPATRRRLIAAHLLGGNVTVAEGRRRGGDFERVAPCRDRAETGCVVAYSTYDETPPSNARYGRATERSTIYGLPGGPGYEAVCTNPASLVGAKPDAEAPWKRIPRPPGPQQLRTILRTEPFPGSFAALFVIMFGGPPPSAPTPWLVPADRYSGECVSEAGADYLRVAPIGDSRDLNPSPDPSWGLHLLDVNLALGDLVKLAGHQARAYLRSR